MDQGSPDAATLFEQSLSLATECGSENDVFEAHIGLGRYYFEIPSARDFYRAARHLNAAEAMCDADDVHDRAYILRQFGRMIITRLQEDDDDDDIRELAMSGIDIYVRARQITPPDTITDVAKIDQGLGYLHLRLGELYAAREHYQDAARAWMSVGNYSFTGTCLTALANIAVFNKEWSTARHYAHAAIGYLDKCGESRATDKRGVISFLSTISELEENDGSPQEAENGP